IREDIATPLDRSVESAATGILDVANANMERALRVISVERGHDPREFCLVAFGGAGPLHATQLAESLEIPRVLIPRAAGVLSALGLVVSDVVRDHSVSRIRSWSDVDPESIEGAFLDLQEDGERALDEAGVPPDRRYHDRHLEIRYEGQSFDVRVDCPKDIDEDDLNRIADKFHEKHDDRYGHADPQAPIELATLRVQSRGKVSQPPIKPPSSDGDPRDAMTERRDVMLDGEWNRTPIFERSKLPIKSRLDGPAIVEGSESTTLIKADQTLKVDDVGNIIVEVL
ncbi:MAG: hydantoinase/oxoprolinase family protein, partial [Halobacteriaceae archaeon]